MQHNETPRLVKARVFGYRDRMMQPPAALGRKRSEASRAAILHATMTLLRETSFDALTTDAIASAAGVGKQTIYRWWSSKADVVLEALMEHAREVVAIETGNLEGDVRGFVEATVRLLRGPRGSGPILKGLMAEAQLDADFAPRFATFIGTRRAALRAVLARHTKKRDAEKLDAMVDMLYGAMWYRLLIGHGALDASFAAMVGALAARGLAG